MKLNKYQQIEKQFGDVASWAVWASNCPNGTRKANIGDMSIFKGASLSDTLNQLNPNIVMVGLNCSRKLKDEAFVNFHDSNPNAHDYKLRYAFANTVYSGAYMTDILKDHIEVDSKKVKVHLQRNPEIQQKEISYFRNEMDVIGAEKPLILAFGKPTHEILEAFLQQDKDYSELVRLKHYAYHISDVDYRAEVLKDLESSASRAASFHKHKMTT